MGFVAFPMPEVFPRHYWLFHSIWHCCLAAGYYELYALIEEDSIKGHKGGRQGVKQFTRHAKKQPVAMVMQKAGSNSSLDSTSELASTTKSRSEVCQTR